MLGVGRRGPLGRDEPDGAGAPHQAPGVGVAGPASPIAPHPAARVDERERDAWVILGGAEGVGPVTFGRLVAAYGSAAGVLDAARSRSGAADLAAAAGTRDGGAWILAPGGAADIVARACQPERALAAVRRSGVGVLVLADEAYPSRLRAVDMPPPVLFLHGSPAALERARSIAIVGTRRPTSGGRLLASRIAEAVAGHGATIVSGLALGIDAAAHATAVRCGTPTVAVIGGGHERLYPAGHRDLARRIVEEGGAVLSEFAPDTRPTRGTFPRRNRLISGLADATVVVEAGARSGALTTAAWALEQGRGLHLVPGRPDDPSVAGCLAFLREAGPEARVVAGVPELLEDLGYTAGWGARARQEDGPGLAAALGANLAAPAGGAADRGEGHPVDPLAALPSAERALARRLLEGAASADELAAATGLAPATVLAALTGLEMRGLALEAFARYQPTGVLAGRGSSRSAIPAVGRWRPRNAA
jgi:DNA processing protein